MSWFFSGSNQDIALYEPPATTMYLPAPHVAQVSTWGLIQEWLYSVTVMTHGMAQATLVMAGAWGSTLKDLWPWLVFLVQILCAIALLKLAVYALRTLEEFGSFVYRFIVVVGYFMGYRAEPVARGKAHKAV